MGVGFFTILRLFMSLMYLLQSSVDGWTTVGWQALLISAEAADCTQAALDWAHCCTFGVKTLLAARLHPHRSTSDKKLQSRAQHG